MARVSRLADQRMTFKPLALSGSIFLSNLLLALSPASGLAQSTVTNPQRPLATATNPYGTLNFAEPNNDGPQRTPEFVGKSMPDNATDQDTEKVSPSQPTLEGAADPNGPATGQGSQEGSPAMAPDVAARLKSKARAALQDGDVAVARALLKAVAVHRDPEATFLLAQTYDTQMLSQWGVIGVEANQGKAAGFYEQARRDGYVSSPDGAGEGHP